MEWIRLHPDDEEPVSDELRMAIYDFQPVDPTRDADLMMADWLQEKAHLSPVDVWLLMEGRAIAAYHTSGEEGLVLPSGEEVLSLHMGFAARSGFHRGAGGEIVRHLIGLTSDQGFEYASLDPFDNATEAVWERHGFRQSLTRAQDDPTSPVFRMWRRVD